MNEDEFDAALTKLHNDFKAAVLKNSDNRTRFRIGCEAYSANAMKIVTGYFNAKHKLYEDRYKAQVKAKTFSNGTQTHQKAQRRLTMTPKE